MSDSASKEFDVQPRLGFAIASLVFGILALLSSVIVIGVLFGAVGLLLGVIHLFRRQRSNGMAWIGMVLSVGSIVLGISFGLFYYKTAIAVFEQLSKELAKLSVDQDAWKGVPAPDFTVTSLEGTRIQLSEFKGKRVIVDFWATWCGPCVEEISHFTQLRKEITEDELIIIGISEEEPETLKEFVKKHEVNYPIVSAHDLPEPYKSVTSIPTTCFIDRNGVIQDVTVGYRNFDELKLLATSADYVGELKTDPTAKPGEPVESDQR